MRDLIEMIIAFCVVAVITLGGLMFAFSPIWVPAVVIIWVVKIIWGGQ